MRQRALVALALAFLAAAVAPETRATMGEWGYASAYAPGVMEGVVELRFEHDIWRVRPPVDWYQAAGYVAAMDCQRVGEMATLIAPDGRESRVLIADCAGADGPADRFSSRQIIVELDARMWERLTAVHGRPLQVGLR